LVVTDCVTATGSLAAVSFLAAAGAAALELPKPGRICGGIFAFNASKMLPALLGAGSVVGAAVVGANSVDSLGVAASSDVTDLAGSTLAGFDSCFSSAGGADAPGVSSSFAKMFQLSFIFIENYFCS
jgi:hypothetical protein